MRSLLAYKDPAFIDADAARPVRIVSEYLAPLQRLCEQRVRDTVVFFGSARIREDGPLGKYVTEARELARLVTEWSLSLPDGNHRLVVCSGGGGGIMEAANHGAALAGGRSIGLNIGLPHEQRPNAHISPELVFEFHYFFMRKLWFAHLARAIVVFPGGFGTLDELFEILTLAQTHKLDRRIGVLLYGESYWREIVNFDALVRHGFIDARDVELFSFVEEPRQALSKLQECIQIEPGNAPDPAFAKSKHISC
ncbi:MAG TPA: TIGR00730 family Rossman fold protein [Steroidobacteraceae bacterium]|nr:TIGR00730 family Rossman fold protein [Steroidobacteraceae bacterium]